MTDNRTWWERPNRVLLVNLREGDERAIRADELVRDVKSFGATAFCINGGGIVAFYQTRIPGHRLSTGLGGRDLLAEVIPAAHAAGLHVLARIDPSCAPSALAEGHPDGIWNNQGKFAAWDTGPCYCDNCRSLFRRDSGSDIPPAENWDDPVWRRYNEWRYARITDWVKRMHAVIHEAKRDAIFIAAVQLMESLETIRPGGWDIDYWVPYQDVLTFECQRRNSAPWWPGIQAKYLASLAPDRPRWMTASYFYPWWRLYASPETENRPWIAQQFANGVNTWLHLNGGYSDLFDRRGLAPMRATPRTTTAGENRTRATWISYGGGTARSWRRTSRSTSSRTRSSTRSACGATARSSSRTSPACRTRPPRPSRPSRPRAAASWRATTRASPTSPEPSGHSRRSRACSAGAGPGAATG
jgi:hypothetical protein